MSVFPEFATGSEMVFFSPIVETTWENINGEVSGIFVSVKKGIIPAADAFVPAAAFLQGFRGFVARTFSAWQKCRGGCRVMHGVFFIGKDVIVCTCPCLDGVMLADDAKLRHKMVAEQVVGAVFFGIFDAVEIGQRWVSFARVIFCVHRSVAMKSAAFSSAGKRLSASGNWASLHSVAKRRMACQL